MANSKPGKVRGRGWLYAISLAVAPRRFTLLIEKMHAGRLRLMAKRAKRKALKRERKKRKRGG